MATLFDRFSPPARQAMSLAQEEARSLGHGYLGTEHLLLALVSQPEGTAAATLVRLGADRAALRGAIERIVGRGTEFACGSLGLAPRLKRVLELAGKEAKQARSACVEPEHLLLGLSAKDGTVASGILHEFGITAARIREALPTARAAALHQDLPSPSGTRRYTLVFPEDLFSQVERLAATEHTTVVDLLRRSTKLGLLATDIQRTPGAALLVRDAEGERQILLL